jgi:Rieske Fe-S protein
MSSSRSVIAEEDQPGSDERPQKGDVLVFSEGEHAGEAIKPQDLQLGGPPVHAWPSDLKTSVIRKGSRLNEILVVRLDPAELDDETRAHAADGIVAYSAICSHAGCPITGWLKGATGDNDVFKCFCHNSEFDPRHSAQVVFGPAPRRLAVLPLTAADGSLAVVAAFVGKLGAPPFPASSLQIGLSVGTILILTSAHWLAPVPVDPEVVPVPRAFAIPATAMSGAPVIAAR